MRKFATLVSALMLVLMMVAPMTALEASANGGGNGNQPSDWICHAPPGNEGNPQSQYLPQSAIESHLANHPGDYLGKCADDTVPSDPGPQPEAKTQVREVIDGALVCSTSSVEQVTVYETAGYYLGDDNKWHLGTFVESGREVTGYRAMTADEIAICAGPQPDNVITEVASEPAHSCTDGTVNVTFTEMSASYTLVDGDWVRGEPTKTGNSRVESTPMNDAERAACRGEKPDPVVEEGEWTGGEATCAMPEVAQTRTITTTDSVPSEDGLSWVPGEPTSTTETQTVSLSEEELAECEGEEPEQPVVPVQITQVTLACTGEMTFVVGNPNANWGVPGVYASVSSFTAEGDELPVGEGVDVKLVPGKTDPYVVQLGTTGWPRGEDVQLRGYVTYSLRHEVSSDPITCSDGSEEPQEPTTWAPGVVTLECTDRGVNVTFTVNGTVTEGDQADVQVRRATGGTPIVSDFADVTPGNPGPYAVAFESEDLTGELQAWVFKVGTNSPAKSTVVDCGGAAPEPTQPAEPSPSPEPTQPANPTPAPTEPAQPTPVTPVPTEAPTQEPTKEPSAQAPSADTGATPAAQAVTGMPVTGSGPTTKDMVPVYLASILAVVAAAGAVGIRRREA